MKSTYTTPTVTTSGDAVSVTLSGKILSTSEVDAQNKRQPSGSNLSFGL